MELPKDQGEGREQETSFVCNQNQSHDNNHHQRQQSHHHQYRQLLSKGDIIDIGIIIVIINIIMMSAKLHYPILKCFAQVAVFNTELNLEHCASVLKCRRHCTSQAGTGP